MKTSLKSRFRMDETSAATHSSLAPETKMVKYLVEQKIMIIFIGF